MPRPLEKYQLAERSIITEFRKKIYSRFAEAVKRYALIEDGDRIAVCVSGGKDSFLLAKLVQEYARHGDIRFSAEYICMDPGYSEEVLSKVTQTAETLNVPLKIFPSDVFAVADEIAGESPCYMCARMRRGFLYGRAKELGCNKIALGHHKTDVVVTSLMSMLYGGQLQGMLPKLRSNNFEGMQLIRPLYCVSEDDIAEWACVNGLSFINCACKKTENRAENYSAREEVKNILARVKSRNPDAEDSVFAALHNVKLDTLVGFEYDGKQYFMQKFRDGR